MKKEALYVIITVLLVIIAIGGTYIVMKEDNKPTSPDSEVNESSSSNSQQKENNNKSGVELVDTEVNSSSIVQTFNAYMNGKAVSLKVSYTYGKDDEIEYVKGLFGDKEVYYHDESLTSNSQKDSIFKKSVVDKDFNVDNFIIIKGTDNVDYLLVASHAYDKTDIGRSDYLYVYNDNLELIDVKDTFNCNPEAFLIFSREKGIVIEEKPWYNNNLNVDTSKRESKIKVKVENDQIYYLKEVFDTNDPSKGTLEERVYTINNNNLTYNVINSYKIVDAAGGTC